jgi:hypothetical protein
MTNFNKPIAFILRSPLHRMLSRSLLLTTFTGRKSGKAYTTPISFSEHDGEIYAFTRAGAAHKLITQAGSSAKRSAADCTPSVWG